MYSEYNSRDANAVNIINLLTDIKSKIHTFYTMLCIPAQTLH
ncbi:hypothetical protein HMPREF0880_01538 [Yokenella regensburgei ATCC 43003]|nr:hypothetical protein HMPREF0880_01538 [Yokenella regensburgei ATCC 43003]